MMYQAQLVAQARWYIWSMHGWHTSIAWVNDVDAQTLLVDGANIVWVDDILIMSSWHTNIEILLADVASAVWADNISRKSGYHIHIIGWCNTTSIELIAHQQYWMTFQEDLANDIKLWKDKFILTWSYWSAKFNRTHQKV